MNYLRRRLSCNLLSRVRLNRSELINISAVVVRETFLEDRHHLPGSHLFNDERTRKKILHLLIPISPLLMETHLVRLRRSKEPLKRRFPLITERVQAETSLPTRFLEELVMQFMVLLMLILSEHDEI